MHSKFFEITYLTQDSRIADVNGFFLTWYYYGRSNTQEFLMGLLEFVLAILLLFRKTYFLGAILLLPVASNVLLVNIFNRISGITFFVSIIVVVMDIYILFAWKHKIAAFLISTTQVNKPALSKGLKIAGILFKVFVIGTMLFIFFLILYSKIFAANTKDYDQRNKFVGGFELHSLKINNRIDGPETGNFYKSIYLEPQSRWNSVLTFSPKTKPQNLVIKWNENNDSVKTFLKRSNYVEDNEVDSSTVFIGTYKLHDGMLFIDGLQYGNIVNAVYYKKPLKDYKWFW